MFAEYCYDPNIVVQSCWHAVLGGLMHKWWGPAQIEVSEIGEEDKVRADSGSENKIYGLGLTYRAKVGTQMETYLYFDV